MNKKQNEFVWSRLDSRIQEQLTSAFWAFRREIPNTSHLLIETAVLVSSGFSDVEIAGMFYIQEHSIENRRYQLRKTLDLDPGENLREHLQKIVKSPD